MLYGCYYSEVDRSIEQRGLELSCLARITTII